MLSDVDLGATLNNRIMHHVCNFGVDPVQDTLEGLQPVFFLVKYIRKIVVSPEKRRFKSRDLRCGYRGHSGPFIHDLVTKHCMLDVAAGSRCFVDNPGRIVSSLLYRIPSTINIVRLDDDSLDELASRPASGRQQPPVSSGLDILQVALRHHAPVLSTRFVTLTYRTNNKNCFTRSPTRQPSRQTCHHISQRCDSRQIWSLDMENLIKTHTACQDQKSLSLKKVENRWGCLS